MVKVENKIKKVIILGLAILAVLFVGSLFRKDGSFRKGFAIQPLSKGFSLVESGTVSFYQDKLKSYPAPDKFRKIASGNESIEVKDSCGDYYFTILIYPADIDYRQSPGATVLNRAAPCPEDKKFSVEIPRNELGAYPAKSYYLIIADQPKEGTWHNPR